MINAVFREWEFEIMEEYLHSHGTTPISAFYRDRISRCLYDHYCRFIYPRPNFILVYLEDFAHQGRGEYRLLLDFFTFSDYTRFNEEFGTDVEIGDENGIPQSTFFYIENYYTEDKLDKGAHYYLDIRALQAQRVEIKTGRPEGFPVLYTITLPRNEELVEKSENVTLLYHTQPLTYPQWVFSSVYNTNNPAAISANANAELVVWDVKQGNFNEIKIDGLPYTIFDAGTEVIDATVSFLSLQQKLANELNVANVPLFVLSHWHTDHYSLLFSQSNNDLSRIQYYILPSNVKSLSVYCFILRLQMIRACVNMVVLPYGSPWIKHAINDSLTLYANKNYVSNVNNSGLTLFVQGPNNNAMLPGDCRYRLVESQANDCITAPMANGQKYYLVVPHHCGKAGVVNYRIANANDIDGIVSVGKNIHGHPDGLVQAQIEKIIGKKLEMSMNVGDIVKGL